MLALLFLLALRSLLMPDPMANLFFKAQRLEAAGQLRMALRHYSILTDTHPESSYAPMALQHEGDILTSLAQHTHDSGVAAQYLGRAVGIYLRLANSYPTSSLAGDALLSAGDLASNNLQDLKTARHAYQTLLDRYPNNGDYASEATLRLGRVALTEGNARDARGLLQSVLQHYTTYPDRCAEALYHLGVTYETLFKKKDWAQNAYQATFTRYPNSVWASTAKERLGMLFYHQRVPTLRRVLVDVAPLPASGFSDGSLFAALRPLLAARQLEVSDTTLRGWSLQPFYTGYVPQDPGHVVAPPFDGFDNAVSNAGLRYTEISGKDGATALHTLQDEIDAARPPIIYNGHWTLAVGYDTSRQEVFVQNQGARFDTVSTKDLSAAWKADSPLGDSFTLIAFYLPGERATFERPQLATITAGRTQLPTPTPAGAAQSAAAPAGNAPAAAPVANSSTPDLTIPTYVYSLKPLAAAAAHRRALHRAVALMHRPQAEGALLNLEALNALADELKRLSTAAPSPVPQPEAERPTPRPTATSPAVAPPAPATGATPAPTVAPLEGPPADAVARATALLGWFKGPLQHWVSARRDAAAFLDNAANALHAPALHAAANDFRRAITELNDAAAALPRSDTLSTDGTLLNEEARRRLETAALHMRAARDLERHAVAGMDVGT